MLNICTFALANSEYIQGMYPTVIILLVAHNKSHLYATTVIDGLVSDAVFRHPMSQTGELQTSGVHDTVATSIS